MRLCECHFTRSDAKRKSVIDVWKWITGKMHFHENTSLINDKYYTFYPLLMTIVHLLCLDFSVKET